MSKLLRAALCSNDDVQDVAIEIPDELKNDADLLEAMVRNNDIVSEGQGQETAALESLMDAHFLIRTMKDNGTYNNESAQALGALYSRVLPKDDSVALESVDGTEYAVALEGKIIDAIRNGFDNLFQQMVLGQKHQHDIVVDFFKSTSTQVQKYSKALDATEEEFGEKKDKFRDGDHHASLIELWYFFSLKDGHSRNIIGDLKTDADASKHILNDYPKAVLDTLGKLANLIGRTKISSERDLTHFLSEVQKLPSIEKLYGSEFLGEGILFNVTSVVRKIKQPKRSVEIGKERFSNLAELSAPAMISEEKSGKHTFKKVLANTHALARDIIVNHEREDFKLTTEEIGQVIEAGKRYVRQVDNFLSMQNQIERVYRDVDSALERLRRAMDYNGQGAHEGMKQVFDYLKNLSKAITEPTQDEVVRSIKGAKYCNYLALRMIYNASKYF